MMKVMKVNGKMRPVWTLEEWIERRIQRRIKLLQDVIAIGRTVDEIRRNGDNWSAVERRADGPLEPVLVDKLSEAVMHPLGFMLQGDGHKD